MAEEPTADEVVIEEPELRRRRPLARSVLRWLGIALLALLAMIAITAAWLHTKSGREFIVERIAKVAPASGLKIEVGSIEGSVLWSATLHDVKFRDANDTLFLEVPEVDLNWRPIKFFFTGLDVRHLVLHGGTLYAAPSCAGRSRRADPARLRHPGGPLRGRRPHIAEGLLGEKRVIDFRPRPTCATAAC
jgi:translocation and assembly module TamB